MEYPLRVGSIVALLMYFYLVETSGHSYLPSSVSDRQQNEVKVNMLPTKTLANISHETCSNIKEIVGIHNDIDIHSILQPMPFTTCTISKAICFIKL